jgi:hypothetical protein
LHYCTTHHMGSIRSRRQMVLYQKTSSWTPDTDVSICPDLLLSRATMKVQTLPA